MTWASILDWLRSDGLDWGKKALIVVGNLITYTLLYLAGRRSKQKEVEAETAKAMNDEHLRVQKKREDVREEYDEIIENAPSDWLDKSISDRMRNGKN